MRTLIGCISLALMTTISVVAQKKDSLAVAKATEKFLQSFNALDWEGFHDAFSEDATVFFPFWDQASRKSGKNETEKVWLQEFPEFKDSADTTQLTIRPKDILIQLYGSTAIVTFHLGDGLKDLGRRTLVMVKNESNGRLYTCMRHTSLPRRTSKALITASTSAAAAARTSARATIRTATVTRTT